MADGRFVEEHDVANAKVEMVQALRQASSCLSLALAARDRIPTNHASVFKTVTGECKKILAKAEMLAITDPANAMCSVWTGEVVLSGSYEAEALRSLPPHHILQCDTVEHSLGGMIDFVFGQPAHPRFAGPKQAMLWQLEPVLFIFLAFIGFPHKAEDWDYGARIVTDESKVEYLPYWIRMAKEHLEGDGKKMGYRWMFGKNFQITIAKRAHLDYFADFRKAYHLLEFGRGRARARTRTRTRTRTRDAHCRGREGRGKSSRCPRTSTEPSSKEAQECEVICAAIKQALTCLTLPNYQPETEIHPEEKLVSCMAGTNSFPPKVFAHRMKRRPKTIDTLEHHRNISFVIHPFA